MRKRASSPNSIRGPFGFIQNIIHNIFNYLSAEDLSSSINIEKKHNISGKPKEGIGKVAWNLMYKKNPLKSVAAILVPKGIKRKIFSSVSGKILEKEEMPADLREILGPKFGDDVNKLESVIGKDLANWKTDNE